MEEKNTPNVCEHHGQNIAFWRGMAGMSQTELGELLGMSQVQISRIEEKKEIDEETLLKVADALEMHVAQLKQCDHKAMRKFCKSAANIFHVYNGGYLAAEGGEVKNNITNNPLETVEKLYKEIVSLTDKVARLETKMEYMEKVGK